MILFEGILHGDLFNWLFKFFTFWHLLSRTIAVYPFVTISQAEQAFIGWVKKATDEIKNQLNTGPRKILKWQKS